MSETGPPSRQSPDSTGKTADIAGCGAEAQYSVEEALAVQEALRNAFAEHSFQQQLRRIESLHPNRGQRGHPEQQAYTIQLQGLLPQVFRRILPQNPWCLAPGWEGYRQMNMRMVSVSGDRRVIQ